MPSRRLRAHRRARRALQRLLAPSARRRSARPFPGGDVCVRMNPGLGSGSTNRTNTGGPGSSFGIWHEYLDDVKAIAARHGLHIRRLHTHIGSGTDPAVWQRVTRMTLDLAAAACRTSRPSTWAAASRSRACAGEKATDLDDVGTPRARGARGASASGTAARCTWRSSRARTSSPTRARSSRPASTSSTPARDGYTFAKLDTGMTEVTRPSLYGAQHPDRRARRAPAGRRRLRRAVLRVGRHPDAGAGRSRGAGAAPLPGAAIGDLVIVGGAGAYCAGDGDDQLQLLPAGARGDARAGRHAAAAAPAADASTRSSRTKSERRGSRADFTAARRRAGARRRPERSHGRALMVRRSY